MKDAITFAQPNSPIGSWLPGRSSCSFLPALLFILGMILINSQALAEPVAVVVRISGEVAVYDMDGQRTVPAQRDVLKIGDRITTGADAFVTLRFIDQGLVDLGADSDFAIHKYQSTGQTEAPNVLLELLKGRLRTIPGALASDQNEYTLVTPNARINTRSAEFEVWWQPDAGTRAKRTRGSVNLVNRAGLGDPVRLTREAPFGEVALDSPAAWLKNWPGASLGAFPDALLNLQMPGILPPLPPAILPLDADHPSVAGFESRNDSLTHFIEVVQQQHWPDARILAGELLMRYEGTAKFDFHYALLLIHENRTQEAIFALERVLTYIPHQHRARLELARAYFINNNLARSRIEFERVLANEPPVKVQTNIKVYLEQIAAAEQARKRQFNLFTTLVAGWDNNINAGSTLSGKLDPNLLNMTTLSDSSKAVGSSYGQFRFGGQWTRPTSLQSGHTFGLQGQTTQFPDHPDYSKSTLSAHYRTNLVSKQLRGQFWFNPSHTWVADDPWQLTLTAGAQLTLPVWGPLWAGLGARSQIGLAQSGHRTHSVSDALGVIVTAKEHKRSHNFSTEYTRYQLSGSNNGHLEWQGISNRYSLDWQWPKRIQTSFTIQHDWRQYQADDLLFTEGENTTERKRRHDQYLMGDAAVSWQARTWLLSRTGARMEWLDSNINAYSRDQWVLSQSLTLTF